MSATRRSFLTSAAAVYQLAAKSAVPPPAAKETVNLGFIGSGIRGKQLIDEFLEVKGARGIAVADLYDGCLERAKEQLGANIATGKDYRTVLDNKDVDAVVIATPDHWHERIVLDALSAGKHVYVEKPMTWTLAEGPRIMAAAAASKKVLQVGSQAKTSALTAKAKELIAGGAIGKVNMVRMANHRNSPEGAWQYPVPPDASEKTIDWKQFLGKTAARPFDPKIFFQWRRFWDFSGGVAADLFVHQFTQMHEILNVKAPVSAVSQGGTWKWKDGRTVPDVMNSLLEYGEEFLCDVYVNQANAATQGGLFIMGSEGTMQVTSGRLLIMGDPQPGPAQEYGSENFPKRLRDAYLAQFAGQTGSRRPQPKPVEIERGPSHNWYFIDSIVNSRPSRENAEEGHYAAAAAHLCNIAYRKSKRVSWDRTTGKVRF